MATLLTPAFTTKTLASIERVVQLFRSLNGVLVNRKELITQVMFAILTREHVLIEGPPGTAKSMLARLIFDAINGARTFHIQCTRKMTEDAIVGPPNVKILRQEGRFVHNVEGTLVTAHFGFLDEIMDLSSGALRAMLEILNERSFSRGRQKHKAPLLSAIATTNFNRDDEAELEAVLDRFLFRNVVMPLSKKGDRLKMLRAVNAPEVPKLTLADIVRVQNAVTTVEVPEDVLDTYLEVCQGLDFLTDRTINKAVNVLRASALLDRRKVASVQDVGNLYTCFVTPGKPKSEQAWANAIKPYKAALEKHRREEALHAINMRLYKIVDNIENAESYEEAEEWAREARAAENALENFKLATSPDYKSGMKYVQKALELADALYATRKI